MMDEDIDIVCQAAFAWAGEYGYSNPEAASRVWSAAVSLRPELEPES